MNAGLALSSPTANAATESYPDYAVSPVITAANRSNRRTGTGPNNRRPHQALDYRTPAEVFYGEPAAEELKDRRCSHQPVLRSSEEVQESHLIVA